MKITTEEKILSFHVSNMSISNFGRVTSTGSTLTMRKLSSGSITDVRFFNNSGEFGGAVLLEQSPNMHFVRCVFERNSAVTDGGGVLAGNSNSGLRFEECVFVENSAVEGLGGGIFIRDYNDDVLLTRCNFTLNFAVRGYVTTSNK